MAPVASQNMRQAVSGNVDDDRREEACIHAQSDQQTTTLLEMIAEVIARVQEPMSAILQI